MGGYIDWYLLIQPVSLSNGVRLKHPIMNDEQFCPGCVQEKQNAHSGNYSIELTNV